MDTMLLRRRLMELAVEHEEEEEEEDAETDG